MGYIHTHSIIFISNDQTGITKTNLYENFEFHYLKNELSSFILIWDWDSYNNYCVSSEDADLVQTTWSAGDASRDACKSQCIQQSTCSAFEWYESAWAGSKCKLMLGDTPAVMGHTGSRFIDSECHIKPVPRK